MESSTRAIVISVFTLALNYIFPSVDLSIKIGISTLIGEVYTNVVTSLKSRLLKISNRKKFIIIDKAHDGDYVIFDAMEKYIIEKFQKNLKSCEVVNKLGSVSLSVNTGEFYDTVSETHKGHNILIQLQTGSQNDKHNKIYIESFSAPVEELKDFVCEIVKKYQNIKKFDEKIHIFTAKFGEIKQHTGRGGDKDIPREKSEDTWEEYECKTNKTIQNTILSKKVTEEFVDDVAKFISNKTVYQQKGLVYTRGYVIYGPPGTGKTSIIKAIAREYGMCIFGVSMNQYPSVVQLSGILKKINNYNKMNNYIVVFEDFDKIIRYEYGGVSEYSRNIANVLIEYFDGTIEANGRIIIMTANDITLINQLQVLVRPGRIDKFVKFDYCDPEQTSKIIKLYYDEKSAPCDIKQVRQNMPPSQLINFMQTHNITETLTYASTLLDPVQIKETEITESKKIRSRRRYHKKEDPTIKIDCRKSREQRLIDRMEREIIRINSGLLRKETRRHDLNNVKVEDIASHIEVSKNVYKYEEDIDKLKIKILKERLETLVQKTAKLKEQRFKEMSRLLTEKMPIADIMLPKNIGNIANGFSKLCVEGYNKNRDDPDKFIKELVGEMNNHSIKLSDIIENICARKTQSRNNHLVRFIMFVCGYLKVDIKKEADILINNIIDGDSNGASQCIKIIKYKLDKFQSPPGADCNDQHNDQHNDHHKDPHKDDSNDPHKDPHKDDSIDSELEIIK